MSRVVRLSLVGCPIIGPYHTAMCNAAMCVAASVARCRAGASALAVVRFGLGAAVFKHQLYVQTPWLHKHVPDP